MNKDPKDIVREGYDEIAEQYDDWSRPNSKLSNEEEIDEFLNQLGINSHILDVGCGSGKVTQYIVEKGYQVTGIDISQKMLDLAKPRVPGATFVIGDMTDLEFNDDSFDGIVSTYAVFHVPRSKHFKLFLDFYRILKKGGALLFNVGASLEGVEGVWDFNVGDGAPMFWSFYNPEKTVELLKSADFEIVFARNAEIQTKTENETHFWILGRAK